MSIPNGNNASPSESDTEIFERLRALKRRFGAKPNLDHLALTLISACVIEGWNTRPRIVGALRQLGLNYRHIAIVLADSTGPDPQRHWWKQHADGSYELHPKEEAASDA